MKETEKAYFAGFLDGEGCFTVTRASRGGKSLPTYRAITSIGNTNQKILEDIHSTYGGCLGKPRLRDGSKPVYTLMLSASATRQLVKDVLPYLRVKREVATLVANFPPRHAGSYGKARGAKTNTAAYRTQSIVYKRIRKLNKRGTRRTK